MKELRTNCRQVYFLADEMKQFLVMDSDFWTLLFMQLVVNEPEVCPGHYV